VSEEVFLDLTVREKGCTKTPVVRLVRELSNIERGIKLRVLFHEGDLPVKVFKALVTRRGLRIEDLRKVGEVYEALLTK